MRAVDDDAPADTSMMRIVHDALRRDLDRARTHLAQPRDADQRRAIGDHLGWLMSFLHAHHESEDAGLYPLTRERATGDATALAVLDDMGRDHEGIAAAITGVESAGAELSQDPSDAAAASAVAALDALSSVLLPHLRREEDEAMPIVSRLVTRGEWSALEQKHNLDPKSTTELG
ncbi:MAG TPA: hemerythrin domain-containing protein, partial [Nocardioides sp.]|nr:hemerythrin domain-containing protein [Nocardioides sp.]